jgi:hypothetical protein
MKWSVLDLSPFSAGSTQGAAIRRLALDEIVINTWTLDPQARVHSYSLLAETFGLSATAAQSP